MRPSFSDENSRRKRRESSSATCGVAIGHKFASFEAARSPFRFVSIFGRSALRLSGHNSTPRFGQRIDASFHDRLRIFSIIGLGSSRIFFATFGERSGISRRIRRDDRATQQQMPSGGSASEVSSRATESISSVSRPTLRSIGWASKSNPWCRLTADAENDRRPSDPPWVMPQSSTTEAHPV